MGGRLMNRLEPTMIASAGHQSQPQQSQGQVVSTVVIGSGPVGLLAARQLEGMEFVHNRTCCRVDAHRHLTQEARIYEEPLKDVSDIRSRGKTIAGRWFDRFSYGAEGEEPCLAWRNNPDRKVDWLLFSNNPPGGSWNQFHPQQLTVSPYEWMSMPDASMPDWASRLNPSIKDTHLLEGVKCTRTNAFALCEFYRKYAHQHLPAERLHFNHWVSQIEREDNGLWQVVVVNQTRGTSEAFLCSNLVVATGKTHERTLGLVGERNLQSVVHNSRAARERLETLPSGSQILVVGRGLSAVDVVNEAWRKKIHVTHLIRDQEPNSSYRVLTAMKDRPRDFATHFHYLDVVEKPELEPNLYTQLKGRTLDAIKDGNCGVSICRFSQQESPQAFHMTAILAGTEADLSFLPEALRADIVEGLNPHTMEAFCGNLFFTGRVAGENFQRFGYGHTVAATETIKNREQDLKKRKE